VTQCLLGCNDTRKEKQRVHAQRSRCLAPSRLTGQGSAYVASDLVPRDTILQSGLGKPGWATAAKSSQRSPPSRSYIHCYKANTLGRAWQPGGSRHTTLAWLSDPGKRSHPTFAPRNWKHRHHSGDQQESWKSAHTADPSPRAVRPPPGCGSPTAHGFAVLQSHNGGCD
jgi:hypothetical protein